MGKKCQYLAQKDQKRIFWTKFGRFGAKNPNFTGVSKSFGTHIGNLSAFLFGQALDQMGHMPIFGQKCQFWAKFGRFWAKNPILAGGSKTFGTLISENQCDTFLC